MRGSFYLFLLVLF